ncbi:gp53-like domain-containing protein [Burkholderia multivorans]|uniref:gp53-like domain-containing protein n=1 Tax=Burkholderia multivorans TaxID=87883 RepID=UPI000CFE5028|nr:hypothetical protein [Burkholderia multivorans]PRG49422.1 hypothetical protein C6T62_01820 [Burkholderia multivorans]
MDRLIAPNTVTAAQADTAPATGTPGYATDGNPASNIPATRWPAYQYNAIQEELMAIIAAGGLMPDRTNNAQVAAAITRICLSTAVLADTGAANAYAAANTPPLTVLPSTGFIQRISIAHANTGASTYAPDGLTAKPIYGLGLQPLQGGELVVNGIATLIYLVAPTVNSGNGAWILLGCTGGTAQLGAGSYGVTPPQFDNSTKLATTAFVQRALGNNQNVTLYTAGPNVLTAAQVGSAIWLAGNATYKTTLPSISSVPTGSVFSFFSSNIGNPTVAASGTDIIHFSGDVSSSSVAIGSGETLTIVALPGYGWFVIGGSRALQNATVSFGSSLSANGYQKLPTGLIKQWGFSTTASSGSTPYQVTVTFPMTFPNAFFGAVTTNVGGGLSYVGVVDGPTTSAKSSLTFSSGTVGWQTFFWYALGR